MGQSGSAGQPEGWTASHYNSLWFWKNAIFPTSQDEKTMLTDYDNDKRNLLYLHASIIYLYKDLLPALRDATRPKKTKFKL